MPHKIDFHVHSKYSYDSLSSLDGILKKAKQKGLSGVAITDHSTIKGGTELARLNKDRNFKVIVGAEIKTEYGDIIGLFLKKEIKAKKYVEVIREIKSQGGVVVIPHPFRRINVLNVQQMSKADAIEVFNSRVTKIQNQKARESAEMIKKPFICGSDAHTISEIGNAYVELDNISDLKKTILKNNKNNKIIGELSPRYVHYMSAFIGNCRKGTLIRTIARKVVRK